ETERNAPRARASDEEKQAQPDHQILPEGADRHPPSRREAEDHGPQHDRGNGGVEEGVSFEPKSMANANRREGHCPRENERDGGGQEKTEEQPRYQGGIRESDPRKTRRLESQIGQDGQQRQREEGEISQPMERVDPICPQHRERYPNESDGREEPRPRRPCSRASGHLRNGHPGGKSIPALTISISLLNSPLRVEERD